MTLHRQQCTRVTHCVQQDLLPGVPRTAWNEDFVYPYNFIGLSPGICGRRLRGILLLEQAMRFGPARQGEGKRLPRGCKG